jgi:hypothetical protein
MDSRSPASPTSPARLTAERHRVVIVHPRRRPAVSNRWRMWALLGLTAVAAVLRFWELDRPTLGVDEAGGALGISGTFAQLLDSARHAPNPPVYALLTWPLARLLTPSPHVLRFIPALAGSLLVPAVYFLARQLVPRRTALIAAALAVFSAFTLRYSRHAGPYTLLWLAAALHVGSLLWWLRSGRRLAYLAWLAAGLLMLGVHSGGLLIAGIEPLLVLTSRLTPRNGRESLTVAAGVRDELRTALLFLAGLLVMLAGPVAHHLAITRWQPWQGLRWIDEYNASRSGAEKLALAAGDLLLGVPWPSSAERTAIPRLPMRVMNYAALAVLVPLLLGLMPWPTRWRGSGSRSRWTDPPTEPAWRTLFVLLAWIVLPAYVLYHLSVRDPATPRTWLAELGSAARANGWLVATAIVVAAAAASQYAVVSGRRRAMSAFRRRAARLGEILAVVTGLLLACVLIDRAMTGMEKKSLWLPAYLGIAWPAVAVGAAVLIMRLPTAPLRWLAIVVVCAVNFTSESALLLAQVDPPVDRIAEDVVRTRAPDGPARAYVAESLAGFPGPGGGSIFNAVGEYYLSLEARDFQPPPPARDPAHLRAAERWHLAKVADTQALLDDVATSPQLDRIIVWDRYNMTRGTPAETLERQLGGPWHLLSSGQRVVWGPAWRYLYTIRRREYVKHFGNDPD